VSRFHDITVHELGDLLAEETPAPAGGTAAAIAVELAASLVAMAASFSRSRWDEADAVAEQARALRARVAPLAEADADAFGAVLAAIRSPREDPERAARITRALSDAADVPLQIADAAAEIAELANRVAESGNPNLRGDAAAAALLAEAGARTGTNLVHVNLADAGDDPRLAQAAALRDRAAAAAREAERLR
jgi:formiminotetrahydrofolate cyclodeaminase